MDNQIEDFAKARPPVESGDKPSDSSVTPADAVSDILINTRGDLHTISNNLDEIVRIWDPNNQPLAFIRLRKYVERAQNALNYFMDEFE